MPDTSPVVGANFEGRQAKGGRTHLVSSAVAAPAAAALTGRLADVRKLVC